MVCGSKSMSYSTAIPPIFWSAHSTPRIEPMTTATRAIVMF
jgi:hypothetical protein